MNDISFSSLPISPEVLQAVSDMGFTQPSPIQIAAIPSLANGLDVIGQAMTGTGKTAAFAIPLIDKIDPTIKKPQALILCPTRELCVQVAQEIEKLARHKQKIKALAIYGGQSITNQIHDLKKGAHIIIGTPGRTLDHLRRKTLKLTEVSIVVLDEADEMLDMGFRDDIQAILSDTPAERQTVLFSATMSSDIKQLAKRFQKNPHTIKVSKENQAKNSISQYYYHVAQRSKADLLMRILDLHENALCVIFCNTKNDVDVLFDKLTSHNYSTEALHGDMNQTRRNRVMSKFKDGKVNVLLATDVAARGIDVPGIELVVNYELPKDEESYVHRIGRTGRAGLSGKAISLVSGQSIYRIKRLMSYTNSQISQLEIPSIEEIEIVKTQKVIKALQSVLKSEHTNIEHYKELLAQTNSENISVIDLAAAFLRMKLRGLSKEIFVDEVSSHQRPRSGNNRRFSRSGGGPRFRRGGNNGDRSRNSGGGASRRGYSRRAAY
ncbi:MAG: DEAD/DEAH box helicase [Epsilonproteobacteria bacterium]|nr:DEAD/DEAH box helicase [Campylobacterota bacterium]